jgi:serine/threonine-protein kinase
LTQGDPQEAAGVHEGQILAGKYRVEKVLGVGGMGVVVAAQHVQLDEKVAIKFLLPTMLSNQEVVGRFAREARAAVKIKSEHVARVSDVGTLDNGAPYMIMEFLDGSDLSTWLQRQGPLPVEQAIDFVLQACVGVASAHGIGIVHRDLKPANLFCVRGNDGQFVIKVLDFGISKVTNLSVSDVGGSMTHTTTVMGSPFYMSPEQMQSAKDVDVRADIWALGVILYELLTGSTPFRGESYADIAIKVATAAFAPVRTFRPHAPAGLEAVLSKCLEKDKKRRYGNVAELALALADFGTKQSRPSIERIVRIIQASGLSASALALPPSPQMAPNPVPGTKVSKSNETVLEPEGVYAPFGTMAPSATTAPRVPGAARGRRTAAAIIAAAGVLSIAVGVGWRMWAKSQPSVAAGLSAARASPTTAFSGSPTPPALPEPPKPEEHPAPAGAIDVTAAPPPPIVPNTMPTAKTVVDAAPVSGKASPNGGLHSQGQPHGLTPASTPPQTRATPAPAGTASPRVKCDPPYYFDPKGNRVFKPECI